MRSKAVFMALLALAFQASARPVSQSEAAAAARAWVVRGAAFGARIGASVERADVILSENDVPFHAVKMRGGGTVIVSGDTTDEPIVAFTPESVDLSSIDRRSPLWALLNGRPGVRNGVPAPGARTGLLTASANTASATAPAAIAPATAAERRWAELLSARPRPRLLGAGIVEPIKDDADMDDIRVDVLLKTKWGQSTMAYPEDPEAGTEAGEADCFNLMTPGNCVCGCVATAFAQLMRYHCWPVADVPVFKEKCTVKGSEKELETLGGPYDWANMPETELSAVEEERTAQCEAIGRLTYECGVAVRMQYDSPDGSGSGAVTKDVVAALKDRFGYTNAFWCSDSNGLANDESVREKYVYASLDAGYPVLFSIRNPTSGHAVVGDGYGYSSISGERTSYVHLNMGWTGQDDWWYNFPNIGVGDNPESFSGFNEIQGVAYNVFPTNTGSVVSGRILGPDGVTPEPGALVIARGAATNLTTFASARGVYAFILPPGDFEIECWSADGQLTSAISANDVLANSWGNDIVLAQPVAAIGDAVYPTFNSALDAAQAGDVISILLPVELRRSCVLDRDLTITATNALPELSPIVRVGGATISVTGGATLFSNVVFRAEPSTPVFVAAPGKVLVAGTAVFDDIGSGTPGIFTDKPAGFVIAGRLDNAITLECSDAIAAGEQFGVYLVDDATASASARRVVSTRGVDRAGVIESPGKLVWADDVTVDPKAAVAYVAGSDENVYYRSLDRLLTDFPATNVVITKSGASIEEPHVITADCTISSAGGRRSVSVVSATGLLVTGGTLSVSGLEFTGFKGNGIFVADGAEATLAIADSVFRDVEGTNYHSGAVTLLNGAMGQVGGDVTFVDCRASGKYEVKYGKNVQVKSRSSFGGAVYVGRGCSLDLDATEAPIAIVGCMAATSGGGIYADVNASVTFAGDLTVCENSTAGGNADDVFLSDEESITFSCRGDITSGPRAIGLARGEKGDIVAAFDSAAVTDLVATKKAFFNDLNDALYANVDDEASVFVWSDLVDNTVPAELSICSLEMNGVETYYATIDDALAAITADAVLTVTNSGTFSADAILSNKVQIVTDRPGIEISREGDATITVVAGGELTLEDVTIDGGAGTVGLFRVDGGTLVLLDGATVRNVNGSTDRASGAVTVWNDGKFRMESGSSLEQCFNESSSGGGLMIENATAWLNGGEIRWSGAYYYGGGVFVGSQATVYLSNDMTITGNEDVTGLPNNLSVSDDSQLILTGGEFSGEIGYNEGFLAGRKVFGTVGPNFTGDVMDAAHKFTHDFTGDVGMAVSNGSETLLVWSSALDEDGRYEDEDGTVYELVEGDPCFIDPPVPDGTEFTYDGTEKACFPEGIGYTVTGNVGTNAGNYTAAVSVRKGFAWSTGDDFTRDWEIKKATLDMSGVDFTDLTVEYDGLPKAITITGELPAGVTVSYEPANEYVAVGEHLVTARFSVEDSDNYEIADADKVKTATLAIVEPTPPPPPEPQYDTNTPVAIAFQAIERVSATEWHLEITNVVPKCEYRLLFTDDLTVGFPTTDEGWFRAADDAEPTWTTNVIFSAEPLPSAYFWKAEGRQTIDERN